MGKNHRISFSLIFLTTVALFLAGEVNCDLCEDTDNQVLCRSVLKGISDPVPAVEAAINYTITKTKQVVESTTKEAKKNENFETCEEMYDDAVSDLNESIADLKKGDIGGLKANLCSAMTYYTGCDDVYNESGEVSPFATMNDVLERLIDNCLAIVSKLT